MTQELVKPTCWVSAVDTSIDAEIGRVRWKRQLGLLCHGEPLVVNGKVLALDNSGALFLFDPAQHPPKADEAWQSGGLLLSSPPLAPDYASTIRRKSANRRC